MWRISLVVRRAKSSMRPNSSLTALGSLVNMFLRKADPHGNCRNGLGGTIVQVTGQFFPSFFLEFDHAFAFIHHILVETCILDCNHCLAAEDIQKFAPPGGEKIRLRMTKKQDAVCIEAAAEREAVNFTATHEGDKTSQFRVVPHIFEQDRFIIFNGLGDSPLLTP